MAATPIEIGGLPIPDNRPVFLVILSVHVAVGLVCAVVVLAVVAVTVV